MTKKAKDTGKLIYRAFVYLAKTVFIYANRICRESGYPICGYQAIATLCSLALLSFQSSYAQVNFPRELLKIRASIHNLASLLFTVPDSQRSLYLVRLLRDIVCHYFVSLHACNRCRGQLQFWERKLPSPGSHQPRRMKAIGFGWVYNIMTRFYPSVY